MIKENSTHIPQKNIKTQQNTRKKHHDIQWIVLLDPLDKQSLDLKKPLPYGQYASNIIL